MNLFEILPSNFFSVLSSKNKALYVDALMLLHKMFRNSLNISTDEYIAELVGLLDSRFYEIEDDDVIADGGGLTLNAKARLIIGRFIASGWIDREYMDGSFVDVLTPRSYAIYFLQVISDLCEDRTKEYNSLVFSTYSGLKEARDNQPNLMYEAVINAKSNTERLVYELKTLYHGIRGYLRKIQGQRNVNVLLSEHFDEYKELVDRIYHPIKTMDSIYRYMAPIRDVLVGVLGNAELMDDMRKHATAVRRYADEFEAGREIAGDIDYVLDIYKSLGGIISEIDVKHNNYTRQSIDTIRYHMTADHTISSKLATLLKSCAESAVGNAESAVGNAGSAAASADAANRPPVKDGAGSALGSADAANRRPVTYDTIIRMLEAHVHINRQEFFDGQSLWHRNVKSGRSSAGPLALDADARLNEEDSDRLIATMRDEYSLLKIKKYMDAMFGDTDEISTRDMGFPGDREFITILLASVRAGERGAGFSARTGDGAYKINGYGVPEIIFTKKK